MHAATLQALVGCLLTCCDGPQARACTEVQVDAMCRNILLSFSILYVLLRVRLLFVFYTECVLLKGFCLRCGAKLGVMFQMSRRGCCSFAHRLSCCFEVYI